MDELNNGSFTAERLSGPEYLKRVNELLSGRYGVSYSADELWRDIHGCQPGSEMAKLKKAIQDGETPERFVRTLADVSGFRPIDQMPGASHDAARKFNQMKAGLIGFADQERFEGDASWAIGLDGTVYKQGSDGVAKMEPRQTDRGWDYMVSEAPQGLLENTGAGALLDLVADFQPVASGPDIGDAWDNFLSARPSYGPGVPQDEETYRPRA
ncbi:hypothetical protein BHAOGJBA_1196 [Methylobacterium hispanicum]|uniref:Uncharacterized protein n=1 Tax=Methylobacterium hispanicum TaxID=270350 RepID=A0AAV4ZHT8_9HYPH|nr:hypothetical protein [Methylobacterium hispanicum]GJD87691.1 hypothetical protein BHAOGJBA_1196 [Methylobacterium hispanicum]